METCKDVMTKNPICCLSNDNVMRAARLMKDKDIGSIPVIENELTRKLVGIVTDRDLALEIVAEGHNPSTINVEDVMTRSIVTCHAEDDLDKALEAMSQHQLRRIPIVDSQNRIVGIIAQADVATRIDQPEKTAEVVKEISL
jgi:CBS domain-containing protein